MIQPVFYTLHVKPGTFNLNIILIQIVIFIFPFIGLVGINIALYLEKRMHKAKSLLPAIWKPPGKTVISGTSMTHVAK